jgi:hypothetical protein
MPSKNKINRIIRLGLIAITIGLFGFFNSACNAKTKKQKIDKASKKADNNQIINTYKLKNGDLVFRKGKSLESQAILMADKTGNYSHVGIVYIIDNEPYVIHITPDSLEQTTDYAKCEKLNLFFDSKNASKGCVLRIDKKYAQTAQNAADSAFALYKSKVIFDKEYNLETDTEMYCTELVLKSYKRNDIQLISIEDNARDIPFFNNRIIFPSAFFKCSYLNKMYYF